MKKAMFLTVMVVVLAFSVPAFARIGMFNDYLSINGNIYAPEGIAGIEEKIATGMKARGFEVFIDNSDPAAMYCYIEKDMTNNRVIWAEINVTLFDPGVFFFDIELYLEAKDLNYEITPLQLKETLDAIMALIN